MMKQKQRTPYYEKHPVSPERKLELLLKGYKILDIRFAPEGWKDPEAPKSKRVKKAEETEA